MQSITKIRIEAPAHDVFEAFVDPKKIGGFWFSSSSERWAKGKEVTLRYDEYGAEGVIRIEDVVLDREIAFGWSYADAGHRVTISLTPLGPSSTAVAVEEGPFDEGTSDGVAALLDNKEGWVYALTCLKAYLELGATTLRASLLK